MKQRPYFNTRTSIAMHHENEPCFLFQKVTLKKRARISSHSKRNGIDDCEKSPLTCETKSHGRTQMMKLLSEDGMRVLNDFSAGAKLTLSSVKLGGFSAAQR